MGYQMMMMTMMLLVMISNNSNETESLMMDDNWLGYNKRFAGHLHVSIVTVRWTVKLKAFY